MIGEGQRVEKFKCMSVKDFLKTEVRRRPGGKEANMKIVGKRLSRATT